MIAFSWQSEMPVNCSYHFRIGKKRSRILALSSGTCHCSRNSFVPLRHSPYSRNASAYSTSSSIGISWRHRQHQSTGRGKAYSRRRLGLTPNGFARKGRKGSRERNRRLRSLGFHSSTDRTTTERPPRAMIPWVRYPRSGNRDYRFPLLPLAPEQKRCACPRSEYILLPCPTFAPASCFTRAHGWRSNHRSYYSVEIPAPVQARLALESETRELDDCSAPNEVHVRAWRQCIVSGRARLVHSENEGHE